MSLTLLDAHQTAKGLAVTFATEHGLEPLEGSHDEVARLAAVMQQVSVVASLNETDKVWLEDVVVGNAVVRLGLDPMGEARVAILRD